MTYFDDADAWQRRLLDLLHERPHPIPAEAPDIGAITRRLEGEVAAAEAAWEASLRKYGLDPAPLAGPLPERLDKLGRAPGPQDAPLSKSLENAVLAADAALTAQLKSYGLDPEALEPRPAPTLEAEAHLRKLAPSGPQPSPGPQELIRTLESGVAKSREALEAMMRKYGLPPEELAKVEMPEHPFSS